MNTDLRIGYFTAQPSCIDPFHGFDPDSYTPILACYDTLTRIGENGELLPSLATKWERVDPLTIEFNLREGVTFHNGEVFNADAVVATIAAQRDPQNNSPTGQGILSSIKEAEKVDDYCFRIHTHFPDGMLLWRLAIFSPIAPPQALEKHGIAGFRDHPIGTGPYMFDSMQRGKYIRYVKNPHYWGEQPGADSIRFVIMPAPNWVEALIENKLDLVYGLHSVQTPLLANQADISLKSKLVALSHWFLLANKGPLSDRRVRLAMNYAIDNYMLAKIQGQALAKPQSCIGTPGQFGYNEQTPVFPFNPEKAKELLVEAGYEDGFTLKGIVADHSASLIQMIAAYLADVGIELQYEVVPRTVWMDKIPNAKMSGAEPFAGDFAVAPIDNPMMYSGFHHYILLFSEGPFSITNDPNFDKLFLEAMTSTEDGEQKLKELDDFVHNEALLLFTIQAGVQIAMRKDVDMKLCQSGHFGHFCWTTLKDERPNENRPEWEFDYLESNHPIDAESFRKVLEATQYSSDLFYFPTVDLHDRRLEKIVTNLNYQQQTKLMQDKLRFSQIVQYLNKTRDLEGILDASRFSGIANYNIAGQMVLCNPAFLELFGSDISKRPLKAMFSDTSDWENFVHTLNTEGGLFGSIDLMRTDDSILQAQAACTLRKGSAGEDIGYLLIVRDESQERTLRSDLEQSYLEMEGKVIQRTGELRKTLDQVQKLKQIQDGDYFLTTLLLEPLSLDSVKSENFSIEAFVQQKKTFSFKNKDYEIGGDLNIAYTLQLRGKNYTLILNGDAMGKSIQGAGGILVLGSIMRAIIERSRISPSERQFYPERWLKNTLNEIQLVFESFNGSMLVSAVIGLLDDATGCLYYLNAEHPAPVLFRDRKASFMDETATIRKIGMPGVYSQTRIKIFRMQPSDAIFLGSDGKDDLLLTTDDSTKKINDDESLFLRSVEAANGDLPKLVEQIKLTGDITDDLSLLRISYHPAVTTNRLSMGEARQKLQKEIEQYSKARDKSKLIEILETYVDQYPEDTATLGKLGRLYKKARLFAQAVDFFERLRLRDDIHLKNLQSLVDLHAYMGNTDRAFQILGECLKVNPQNTTTKELQRQLERRVGAAN